MAARIGRLDVARVGVGCNSFGQWADEASSVAIVDAALDVGANFFDTADYYADGESETLLGRALAGRRDEAVVATKFGIGGRHPGRGRADPAFVRTSLDASLRRLAMDHVDLYQLHFPDPDTPVEDTVEVLDDLVAQGLVREIGVCNVDVDLVEAWVTASTDRVRVTAVQNEWSLVRRRIEDSVLAVCRRHDLAVIPFFPLASGLLTGKYHRNTPPPEGSRFAKAPGLGDRYLTDRNLDAAERLGDWARDHDHSLLELAISWLAGRPEVATVITGASRPEQIRANVAAGGWQLTPSEYAEIDRLLHHPAEWA